MAYEDSPSLDGFEEGIPPALPDPEEKRRHLWKIIGVLGFITVALLFARFMQSGTMAQIRGTGSVSGVIVGQSGQPIVAELVIPGTNISVRSGTDGHFRIDGIHAGNRSVVVIYGNSAWEYPVTVEIGSVTDMGTLRFVTTVVPGTDG